MQVLLKPHTVVAHAVNSNREENVLRFSRSNIDDCAKKSECVILKTRNHILNIGTWNVLTLNQLEKCENMIQEAKSNKLDVLGISESRLTNTGMNNNDDTYTFHNSGGHQHEHGVGLLIKKTIGKSLLGADIESDHNEIIAKLNFRRKKIEKTSNSAAKVDATKLMIPEIQKQYSVKVENTYSIHFEKITIGSNTNETQENLNPEQQWQCLKQSVQKANEMLPILNFVK
ncbi:hypothetical protein RRG08_066031 [Elysia crispata]|uniref:Endonuclease/exonuclease/phosphatase domain-containing protein n=1 Tax=Elysia crispata TaxID=231223 RepID=A0AAE1CRI9_9GAST|nr:hypothetical protein RRG08_066031 [Elysia crispata]